MLEWYRALIHGHAICQITAAIHAGQLVSGWLCKTANALAERDRSERHGQLRGTNNWGDDLFELDREDQIVVKPLNCRLQFVPPECVCENSRFSFDLISTNSHFVVVGVECRREAVESEFGEVEANRQGSGARYASLSCLKIFFFLNYLSCVVVLVRVPFWSVMPVIGANGTLVSCLFLVTNNE